MSLFPNIQGPKRTMLQLLAVVGLMASLSFASVPFYDWPTDVPVAGQASYNVAPYEAGAFFDKIACFCFEEQLLMPGETVMMPVSFFVDPAIVNDREGKYIHTITLGYTFYEIDLPDEVEQASLALTSDDQVAIDNQ